jgi:2,4-dienoyl-CoA reductase-like NADH-dependent reductase (Old Yellow Enzyme family)
MKRDQYVVFSEGSIGGLTLRNRLVRSATWDPSLVLGGAVTDDVLERYRSLAVGGVGLIITGGLNVIPQAMASRLNNGTPYRYDDVRVEGLSKLPAVVHAAAPGCRIVAQLESGAAGLVPSDIHSPFVAGRMEPLSIHEIEQVVDLFAQAIAAMKQAGFDGVQLHAAHGGLLSLFLSPYSNRRSDAYGGSVRNRARIVSEIVAIAREAVGHFPILIKANGTDYLRGGIDIDSFPRLARELEDCGVDALEVSGGMWDCLAQSEEQLGFRPVPAPESHTCIRDPRHQSYFLKYAQRLVLGIPVILVGGNRDVERLEHILRRGDADFVAMCRPFISEPRLPRRWSLGEGSSHTDCISCNSCLYWMYAHPGSDMPLDPICVFKHRRSQHKVAQDWLSTWVQKNRVG